MLVLLADDHEGVRKSLTWRMKNFADVVATASVEETLAALQARSDWRGFVFDLRFGPDDHDGGLRLLVEARRLFPRVPAFLLTGFVDPQLILRAAALDARCWPKSAGAEHFAEMARILERERERRTRPNRQAPNTTPSRRLALPRTSTRCWSDERQSGA